MQKTIFTIGHSTQSIDAFLRLLKLYQVEAIADVRSQPYSRRAPQFSRDELESSLKKSHVRYVGARRDERQVYVNDQARYELIAEQPQFAQGLHRVATGAEQFQLALMCAEKDPLTCHRAILVCRHLKKMGYAISHILTDGNIESHEAAEKRLLKEEGLDQGQTDIFNRINSLEDALAHAYTKRGERIAYRKADRTEHEDTHDRLHSEIG
jgi:uncharacterized protein (DUF488 family)